MNQNAGARQKGSSGSPEFARAGPGHGGTIGPMRILRFDMDVARPLTAFGSAGVALNPIARCPGATQIGCMRLAAGGVIGYHQATAPQLFLVVEGAGWVRGAETTRTPIAAGQAAFWDAGEWHESGAGGGMTAIVIEAEGLDAARYLTPAGA
jgi:hypothetical protein